MNIIKAIDIRFNLEYVGHQEGTGVFDEKNRLKRLAINTPAQIKDSIAGNGCPREINHEFKRGDCDGHDDCVDCWNQKAEGDED